MPDAPGSREVRIVPSIGDYVRLLRQTPERVDLAVRKRFRELAATVRDEARGRAAAAKPAPTVLRNRPARGTQHWKALVNSITSGSSSSGPTLSVGSDRVPWALGFEFGSMGGPHKRQFPPWRGNDTSAGYFFYPVVRERQERVWQQMHEIVDEGMAEAFPEG